MFTQIRDWLPFLAGFAFWPKVVVTIIVLALVAFILIAIWAPRQVQRTGVEVDQVLPVYVWSSDESGFPYMGISLIAKIRNNNKKSIVNGINIYGKISLSGNEMLAIWGKDGENIQKILSEASAKQPYYKISWTGWMDDSRTPLELEPNEIRYVKFSILSPTFAGSNRGKILDTDYYGFADGSKTPKKTKTYPFLWEFFSHKARPDDKGWVPTGLRNEFKDGSLSIRILVGNSEVIVHPSKLMDFKMIRFSEWVEKPVEYLFYNKYN